MKLFISDLHLGDGSKTDDFHRDKELLEFFDFAETQAQELIIVGDFLELWQADLDRVLFVHSKVISKFLSLRKKNKVTYVIGNHDYIPLVKFIDSDVGITLDYRDSESGIVAEHGNKYDIFNRYKNPLRSIKWPIGKHFTVVVGELEKFIHPDVDQWAKKALECLDEFSQVAVGIRNKVTPTSKEYFDRGGHFGEFEQAVKNHLQEKAKIVIFGHTHKPGMKKIGNGIYANCGSWVDGSMPTYIACHKDKIELKEALSHNVIEELALDR